MLKVGEHASRVRMLLRYLEDGLPGYVVRITHL